jgi:Flp pilus assembly protein TadG
MVAACSRSFSHKNAMPMRHQLANFWNRLSDIRASRSGSVSMIFSLSLIPIMGLAGIAVDYSNVSRSKSALQSIADSAALSAVSDTIVKPTTPWHEQRETSLNAAKREFEALLSTFKGGGVVKKVAYDAQTENNAVVVKICYTGSAPTSALALAGLTEIVYDGCAQASSAPPVYISVFALVDASSSMGIGASDSDRTLMQSKLGCVFACHTVDWNSDPKCKKGNWWSATSTCAKTIGATTRFEVVRGALIKTTEKAESYTRVSGQFQFGIYKFSNYLTTVISPTPNIPDVKNALRNMTPDALGSGTNFSYNVAEFIKKLPANGDGKSADSPKVFVLILTDGIASNVYERPDCYWDPKKACNLTGSWTGDPKWVNESPNLPRGVFSQSFMSKYCDNIKKKGITVMTLETEFNSSGSTDEHMQAVDRTLRSSAHSELGKCASVSTMAYSANQGAEVDRAIQTMFANVVEKARIVR